MFREQALGIPCAGDELVAILTLPPSQPAVGVLVIVGGPQYRVGSHRQFVLLARALADGGYAAMRFDYRGMGDADGPSRNFEGVTEDIGAAIDEFLRRCPSLARVVLWGLCDAASAALLYWEATRDSRVAGVVLLNPWVRNERSLAQAQVRHYYRERLADPEFWRKFLRGRLQVMTALRAFGSNLVKALRRSTGDRQPDGGVQPFQERMLTALGGLRAPVLLILSERDLTAQEFAEYTKSDARWVECLARLRPRRVELPGADHTFSSTHARRAVERITIEWLSDCFGRGA